MASGEFTLDDAEQAQPVSTSYFREKALEFQQLLNALDATGRELDLLIGALPESAMLDELVVQFAALQEKKGRLKLVAEAINFAANGLNQLGTQLPTVQIPPTLGAVPLVAAGAAAAAIAAAAALIIWGRDWLAGVNQRLRDKTLLESVPEGQRAQVAEAILKSEVALAQANESPLTSVAGIVKWVAIGAVAYFAFQAFQSLQGGK